MFYRFLQLILWGNHFSIWELIASLLRVAGLSIGDFGFLISDLKDLTDRIRVAHSRLRVTRYELCVTGSALRDIQR